MIRRSVPSNGGGGAEQKKVDVDRQKNQTRIERRRVLPVCVRRRW
jgi:hypothetical protein